MAAARYRVVWMCLLLGAALAVVGAPPALAQESRGSMSGTVKDNSGGALPGVTVTATKKDTNQATSTVTNETGAFTLLFLQPGMYAVTAVVAWFVSFLVAVTVTPGSAPPELSLTVPLIEPRDSCASAGGADTRTSIAPSNRNADQAR